MLSVFAKFHASFNQRHCFNSSCSKLRVPNHSKCSPEMCLLVKSLDMFGDPPGVTETSTRFIWRNDRWMPSYARTQLTWYSYVIRGSLKPEARHVRDIDVDINVGEIQKVKFLWNNKVINLFRPTLGASQITVQSGVDGKEYVSDIPSLVSFMLLPAYASSHPSNPSPAHPNILCHLPRMGLCCFVSSSFFHPFPSFFYPFSPFTLDQRGKKARKERGWYHL